MGKNKTETLVAVGNKMCIKKVGGVKFSKGGIEKFLKMTFVIQDLLYVCFIMD